MTLRLLVFLILRLYRGHPALHWRDLSDGLNFFPLAVESDAVVSDS